jgi:hypothetical protein
MTMASPTPTPERKPTVFRLDPDLREWLDSYAERTRRSMNGALNYLLQQAREQDQQAERGEPLPEA